MCRFKSFNFKAALFISCRYNIYRVSIKSGKNQDSWLCLKNIGEKSGNLANSKDNQGNIGGNVSVCFLTQSISYYAKKS